MHTQTNIAGPAPTRAGMGNVLELTVLEEHGRAQRVLSDGEGNQYLMRVPSTYASGDTVLLTIESERSMPFPYAATRSATFRRPSEIRAFVDGERCVVQKNPLGLAYDPIH